MLNTDEHMALFADGREILGSSQKLQNEEKKKDVEIATHLSALDAEGTQIEAARGLIPAFETKSHRVLTRVWGNTIA